MGWSHQPPERPTHRPSGTSTSTTLASSSSRIASASAGCRVPTRPCGSTPPATSPPPIPGLRCRSPGAIPRTGPASWPPSRVGSAPGLAAGAGHERQRLRVPLDHLRPPHQRSRRWPPLHPCRPTPKDRVWNRSSRPSCTSAEAGLRPLSRNRPAPRSTWNAISTTTARNGSHRPLDPSEWTREELNSRFVPVRSNEPLLPVR